GRLAVGEDKAPVFAGDGLQDGGELVRELVGPDKQNVSLPELVHVLPPYAKAGYANRVQTGSNCGTACPGWCSVESYRHPAMRENHTGAGVPEAMPRQWLSGIWFSPSSSTECSDAANGLPS